MLFIDFLIFIAGCTGLIMSSHFVVKSIIKVEQYYHLREFLVGFLLIGILTSLPEISVGILSALGGISSLSFGNVLGAAVVDIALVMGLVAFVGKKIKFESQLEKSTLFIIAFLVVLPLILFLDQELSRTDGIILVAAFALYVVRLFTVRKKFKTAKKKSFVKIRLYRNLAIFVLSLILLVVSARVVVHVATEIATILAFPLVLIGLLIVSPGTSLPELSFELGCVMRGHSSVALGDLLGSLAFNSTLVLGLVSIISPIQAPFTSFAISSVFIVVSLVTFLVFAETGKVMTRREGSVLILLYVLFVVASILMRHVA
ncbi:MAG: hypothetical protein V1818_03625 [Candidatus Aenigmatarchaeota archaeon]